MSFTSMDGRYTGSSTPRATRFIQEHSNGKAMNVSSVLQLERHCTMYCIHREFIPKSAKIYKKRHREVLANLWEAVCLYCSKTWVLCIKITHNKCCCLCSSNSSSQYTDGSQPTVLFQPHILQFLRLQLRFKKHWRPCQSW
jgi:hypothetical protein